MYVLGRVRIGFYRKVICITHKLIWEVSIMFESRCGVCCNSCERKMQVNCTGCLMMEKPFWGGECSEFPCQMLSTMGVEQGFDPAPKIANCKKWADK